MTRRSERLDRLELAHALRTPLTAALLAAGVLEDEAIGALNEAQREAVSSIVGELGRLRRLVEGGLRTETLGAYAGPLEREALGLARLAKEAIEPLEAQSGSERLGFDPDRDEVEVTADATKLRWVVASLAGNALRYARSKARVEVRADESVGIVAVEDDGPGIAPSIAARVFERDGPGLTLYLIREIVEAHGGSVSVQSLPRGGSRFEVRIPRAPSATVEGRRRT